MFKTIGLLKKVNTLVTVASATVTAVEVMYKTFKWYEKKHGKRGKKRQEIARPIIKGA